MKITRFEYSLALAAGFLPFCELRPLPPIAGFWGQWLAVLLFMGWLAWRRIAGRGDSGSQPWPWAALALLALAGLTAVQMVAGVTLYASASLVAVFELGLAALVCAEAARTVERGERERLLEAFCWGSVAALLANGVGIGFAHLGWDFEYVHLAAYSNDSVREIGLISQANHLGVLSVLAWAAAGYLHGRGRLRLVPYLALALLAGWICAASGSRTAALVALAAAALHGAILWRPAVQAAGGLGRLKRRHGVAAIALFLGMQVVMTGVASQRATEFKSSYGVVRKTVPGRIEMARDAALLGARHPALGVGFGRYSTARLFELDGTLPEANAAHAHNVLAQAWAEWGAAGLAVVAAAIAAVLRGLWRWGRGVSDEAGAFLVVGCWTGALLLHSMLEHPLWFAYFLLPFAWMLGLLPHGGPVARTLRPSPAWAIGLLCALGLGAIGLGAADYWRSERLATSVLHQVRSNADGRAGIDRAEALRIAQLTLFPQSADLMQVRVLEIDTMLPDLKLEAATRAAGALPHPETLSRMLAFQAMSGHGAQARDFFDGLAQRNPAVAGATREHLIALAARNVPLTAILQDSMPTVLR